MRSLHRDIGFLVLGLTIIYSISGIVLIYRSSDFLKYEKQIKVQLSPNLTESEFRSEMKMRKLKITEKNDSVYVFKTGRYNRESGSVVYTRKSLPKLISIFNKLHKASNSNKIHWATTVYGVLLFFLAISSLWMFKNHTKSYKRGMILSLIGLILAIVLLIL